MCSHNFGQNLDISLRSSLVSKTKFLELGKEMNKVDVFVGVLGFVEHFRRILVKFWRVSTFPVLLGLVCPGVCLSVRLS